MKIFIIIFLFVPFGSHAIELERVQFFKLTPEDEKNIKLESGSRLYLGQLVRRQLKDDPGPHRTSIRFECTSKDKSSISQCKVVEMNHILDVK